MGGPSVQRGGRSGTVSFANYMDHKYGLAVTKRQSIFSNSIWFLGYLFTGDSFDRQVDHRIYTD